MTTKQKQKGFTLIELLLVLAIISMIIAYSVGIYQSQMLNFNIDKTSMQLQQWLEGARAYYVNSATQENSNGNYSWPVPTSATCTTNALLEGNTAACPQLSSPAHIFILPNTIDTSPWGTNAPYEFLGVVNANTANGTIYEVDLTIPSTVPHAQIVAQRIASRLPSATSNGTTVSVFAAIPAVSLAPGSGSTIISIQDVYCKSNQVPACTPVILPKDAVCPANTTMHEHLSLNNLTAPLDSGGGNVMIYQVNSSTANFSSTSPSSTPAFSVLGPQMTITQPGHVDDQQQAVGNTGQMVAIISCDQNTLPTPTATAPNSASSSTDSLEKF